MKDTETKLEDMEYCDLCYGEVPKDKLRQLFYSLGQLMKLTVSVDLCPSCFTKYRVDQKFKKAIRDHDPEDYKWCLHKVQYYGYGERDTPLEKQLKEIIKTKAAMSKKTII
jgi:hypothetical protein